MSCRKKTRRPLLIFREETTLEEALRQLQFNRISVAVVHNKRKKLVGLLSLEDLLEEIVGEIRDQFERVPDIRLTAAFVPQACDLEVRARDRFELLRLAVERLHRARPVFDARDALEQVHQREKGLSSALGYQTAFPHARIQSLTEPLFSFVRCVEGLDLGAPDGKPVRLAFLILTPFTEPTAQLRLLSQPARLVLNTALRERLLDASGCEQVAEVISAVEGTIPL